MVVVVVYIFHNFRQFIFAEFNRNNNEEGRRSGTTGTGVSQKDLQISEKTREEKKNAKTLVEKRVRIASL